MRVGLTGSAKGGDADQERVLRELLTSFRPAEFHHGDCVGIDELGHNIALELRDRADNALGWPKIYIHPPVKSTQRAFCRGADVVYPLKPYLDRDKDIAAVDVLIAVPEGPEA
jgi:hypothetical protein